jgi:hypothetical protein
MPPHRIPLRPWFTLGTDRRASKSTTLTAAILIRARGQVTVSNQYYSGSFLRGKGSKVEQKALKSSDGFGLKSTLRALSTGISNSPT